MRTKSRCFSNNRRAIVLEYFDECPKEPVEDIMMIDKVRVDRRIADLVAVLRKTPEIKIEGAENQRIRITLQDRICYIPAKVVGNSSEHEIKRTLHSIGINLNGDGMPTPATASVQALETGAGPDPGKTRDLLGIDLSQGTIELLMGAMAGYKRDFNSEIESRIDEAVNEAMEVLGVSDDWKKRAEKAEADLARATSDRERAVADLVGQRNDWRKRAETAEHQLSEMRRNLSGLGALFNQPTVGGDS